MNKEKREKKMDSIEVTVKVEHNGETYSSTSNVTQDTVVGWSRIPETMQKEVDDCVARAAKSALGNVGRQIICAEVKGNVGNETK